MMRRHLWSSLLLATYVVNEKERMVVLNISASGVGALNYSVGVDLLPGTAQGRCIVRADFVVIHF